MAFAFVLACIPLFLEVDRYDETGEFEWKAAGPSVATIVVILTIWIFS